MCLLAPPMPNMFSQSRSPVKPFFSSLLQLVSRFIQKSLWLSLSLLYINTAHAQAIDFVDARFSVEYNNKLTQGENRLRIQHDQDNYQVEFIFDHWMSSSTQSSRFHLNHCQVRPDSYTSISKRPFKEAVTQQLTFDWNHKKVHFTNAEEQKNFDLNTSIYDPISFFFEARCDLMAGKTEFSYPLIHKGSKKTHHYKVIGTELVVTGQGQFEALIIERERNSKSRKTRLYVAPELDYLLVKIEHQESRLVKIIATLDQMDYRLMSK